MTNEDEGEKLWKKKNMILQMKLFSYLSIDIGSKSPKGRSCEGSFDLRSIRRRGAGLKLYETRKVHYSEQNFVYIWASIYTDSKASKNHPEREVLNWDKFDERRLRWDFTRKEKHCSEQGSTYTCVDSFSRNVVKCESMAMNSEQTCTTPIT